jgi:hypothetical protein
MSHRTAETAVVRDDGRTVCRGDGVAVTVLP